VISWGSGFYASLPFSVEPLTDVRRTIPELDTTLLTAPQKADDFLIHQSQVLQVQNNAGSARFGAEQRLQLAEVSSFHSTAQAKDHLSVRGSGDLQHPTLTMTPVMHSQTQMVSY
jgi:hypothetical protein